jgi:threonine aldolase
VLEPQTNIVLFYLERGSTQALIERARAAGVLIGAMRVDARAYPGEASNIQRIRAVTHLDVDREGVLRAAKVISEIAAEL